MQAKTAFHLCVIWYTHPALKSQYTIITQGKIPRFI